MIVISVSFSSLFNIQIAHTG